VFLPPLVVLATPTVADEVALAYWRIASLHCAKDRDYWLAQRVTVFLPPLIVLVAPTTADDRTIATIDSACGRGVRWESLDDQLSFAPLLVVPVAAATATGRDATSLDQAGALGRLGVGQPVFRQHDLQYEATPLARFLLWPNCDSGFSTQHRGQRFKSARSFF